MPAYVGQDTPVCVGQGFPDDRGEQILRFFLRLRLGWGLSDWKSDRIQSQPRVQRASRRVIRSTQSIDFT